MYRYRGHGLGRSWRRLGPDQVHSRLECQAAAEAVGREARVWWAGADGRDGEAEEEGRYLLPRLGISKRAYGGLMIGNI